MTDGSVTIEVELTREQLEKGLKDLKSDLNKLEQSSKGITDKMAKSFSALGSTFTNVGQKLTVGLTVPLSALSIATLNYSSDVEQLETSFEVMTGNAEKAGEIMKELKEIGSTTPFEVKGLAEVTQLLMNYGFTAEDAIDSMEMLGDISQGSADKMNSIALAYGQMSSAGKVNLQDIKQMINAGFNPLQEIAETTGETMESLYDRISKGTISVDEITASMKRSTQQGGKYYKSMEKQSKTLSGKISTLKDTFNELASSILDTAMPSIKSLVDKVTDTLDKFNELDDGTKKTILTILSIATVAGPTLSVFGKVTTGLGNVIKGFGNVSEAIKVANGKMESSKDAVNNLATIFQHVFSPTGLVVTAVVATVGLIVSEISKAEKEMEDKFSTMGESATSFYEGIQTAEGYLSDFNSTLFATTEEQQKLQDEMSEIQEGITQICKTASDERRDYTQEEITQLDEYFEKLRELKNREIQIQQEIAGAITQQAVTNAQTFQGSLEEYKTQSQEWIATAQQQAEATIDIIEQSTIEEVALLNQRYGEEANMQNEAYATEYNNLIAQKQEKIDTANAEVAEILGVYAQGYADRATQDGDFAEHVEHYNWEQEQEANRHNSAIESIQNNKLLTTHNKNQAIQQENYRHQQEEEKIWKNMYKNMSDSEAEQLGSWLAMLAQTELYGGEISEENQEMVNKILESYDSMPKDTREAMENAMSPMLEEMKKSEPTLWAKASGIANGILSRLKKSFDIHSPSKKTRKIFKQVMQGAELGLEDEEKNLYGQVDDISYAILKGLDKGLNSAYENMQKAIEMENAKVISNLTSSQLIKVQNEDNTQTKLESIDNNKEIQVNSTLNLDGKVVATAVNKANAKQKLQYGKT